MPVASKPNAPYCGALARALAAGAAWLPAVAKEAAARETVAAARSRVRMGETSSGSGVWQRYSTPEAPINLRQSLAGCHEALGAAAPFAGHPPAPDEDADQIADHRAHHADDEQPDDQSRRRVGGEPGQPVGERRAVVVHGHDRAAVRMKAEQI